MSTYVLDASDLWGIIEKSCLGGSFGICLAVFLIISVFIWFNGYKVLEWYRHKPMSTKVVSIFFILAVLFSFGCISQDKDSQYYGGWFALPVSMAIGSTIVVGWSIVQRYRYRFTNKDNKSSLPELYRRQRNLVLLAKVMLWIWSCGWVLYFVAISVDKPPHVGAELLLRSAIASLGMFLMNIDSNIVDGIQEHDVLKGMIVCTFFSAVICTALLIMSLVLSRLMAYLHIKHLKIDNNRNHLYLFFGLNDASKLLANDILENDKNSVVVFIENSLVGEVMQNEDRTDGWKNIVNMLTHRRNTFLDANENERRALAIGSCNICGLESGFEDVFGNIGLETVKRLLKSLGDTRGGQLHIFFLSEDRDSNVRATAILAKDEMINNPQYKTVIYCHARRNGVNRIIEDLGLGEEKQTEVRILDSSHLAIEHLKQSDGNHPVNYVSVKTLEEDNPGTVSSPFVSLVMGFGETGQEAVKFLYEYGAFVSNKASILDSYRSTFNCYVLDQNMKRLEGHFVAGIPNVCYKRCDEEENDEALIKFYEIDYRSDDFFIKILDKIAEKLNYVIVAIGDDEENMTAAVEILRYVRKKRQDLENFCIYVRAYEKGSFKHLEEIAQHYNLRLGKDETDKVVKIVLFGQNEQIYTYNLVVKDKYQEDGRIYYETYRSLQIDPANDEGSWDKRHNDTMTSKKDTKWERMSKIRRKESQDRSNALHAKTKIMLLEKVIGKDNVADFALRALEQRSGEKGSITYPNLSVSENRLMQNLAMCEHLRWNAAHEMLGYVDNKESHKCDDLRKKHNCLKPWQDLDNESNNAGYPVDFKLFDFGVVETSFKLEYAQND